jgi:hypothetical protein
VARNFRPSSGLFGGISLVESYLLAHKERIERLLELADLHFGVLVLGRGNTRVRIAARGGRLDSAMIRPPVLIVVSGRAVFLAPLARVLNQCEATSVRRPSFFATRTPGTPLRSFPHFPYFP